MSPIVNLPDKPTVTVVEIANAIGVELDAVRRVLKRGKLRFLRVGHGVRYKRDEVADLLEGLTHDPKLDTSVFQDGVL